MSKEQKTYLLRMAPAQYAEIKSQADLLGVSVNNYVLSMAAPSTTAGSAARGAAISTPQRLERIESSLNVFYANASANNAGGVDLRKAIDEGQAVLKAKEE